MFPKTPRTEDKNAINKVRGLGYCEYCGSHFNLQVHHIKSRKSGGNDIDDNLILLCYVCHTSCHMGNISKDRLKEIVSKRMGLYES